jgi:ribosome-binding protein aMBF1 (putative translation factor)
MPKPLDPFWEYGEPDPPGNRQHLSCKLCGKAMFGGVYRLKYHLAKIPGNEVEICPESSEELVAKATKAIEEYSKTKSTQKPRKKKWLQDPGQGEAHTLMGQWEWSLVRSTPHSL